MSEPIRNAPLNSGNGVQLPGDTSLLDIQFKDATKIVAQAQLPPGAIMLNNGTVLYPLPSQGSAPLQRPMPALPQTRPNNRPAVMPALPPALPPSYGGAPIQAPQGGNNGYYSPQPANNGSGYGGNGYPIPQQIPTGGLQPVNQSGFTSRLDRSHPKISAMADQVAGEFRVSSVALKAMILIEYGGEPDHDNISGSNTTNDSGYNGPMQLSKTVVKECTPDFIAKYHRRPDSTAPLDNIRLGVIYAHHTTEGIDRSNVTISGLYGRHQQGAYGYNTLESSPNERAVDLYARKGIPTGNIIQNIPPGYKNLGTNITAGQFVQGWSENIIRASGSDYRFWL
jgi:hypothetical protein